MTIKNNIYEVKQIKLVVRALWFVFESVLQLDKISDGDLICF